jgi:hypothetical protein
LTGTDTPAAQALEATVTVTPVASGPAAIPPVTVEVQALPATESQQRAVLDLESNPSTIDLSREFLLKVQRAQQRADPAEVQEWHAKPERYRTVDVDGIPMR